MYTHNPAHLIGTCADCGEEMIHNVPRMGPDGGFVHKATGYVLCGPRPENVIIQSPLGTQQLACGNRVPVENPTTIRIQ